MTIVVLQLLLTAASFAAELRYSAMVLQVKGSATVTHAGKRKDADLGFLLYPGDKVEIARNGALKISYLDSGSEEEWQGGARFQVGKEGSSPRAAKVLAKGKVALPSFEYRKVGTHILRYAPPPMVEVDGLSNTRILERTPELRWMPVDSADCYELSLRAGDQLLWQGMTRERRLPYPSTLLPLEPGVQYSWTVKALSPQDGELADKTSCFSLPAKGELEAVTNEVQRRREEIAANPKDAAARLSFILYLKEKGLYDDALTEYRALQKVFPGSSLAEAEKRILELRGAECASPESP